MPAASVEEGVLQQVPSSCSAIRDSQRHCWASTSLPNACFPPHTCCKQREGKEHSESGQYPTNSCCRIQYQHPPRVHRHKVLGTPAPQQRHCYSSPSMPNFSLSSSGSTSFPPALCHQPGGRDRSASSCVESFLSSGQSAEGTDPAQNSHTAVSSPYTPSLSSGPMPQGAPSMCCSTKTTQNCSHHSLQRALTCPPTLPQDQANWQHTSITGSFISGCLRTHPKRMGTKSPRAGR